MFFQYVSNIVQVARATPPGVPPPRGSMLTSMAQHVAPVGSNRKSIHESIRESIPKDIVGESLL